MAGSSKLTRSEFEASIANKASAIFEPIKNIRLFWSGFDDKKQELWKSLANQKAQEIVRMIENKQADTATFDKLCNVLGNKRQEIARELDHSAGYGVRRTAPLPLLREVVGNVSYMTPIGLETFYHYRSQFSFLRAQIMGLSSASSSEHSVYTHSGVHNKVNYQLIDISILGNGIDDNGKLIRIPYSRLTFIKSDRDIEHVVLTHMPFQFVSAAIRYIETIYETILRLNLQENCDDHEYAKNIGLLLWHMYNAMIFKSGSSSTTIMLHSVFMQLHYLCPVITDDAVSTDFRAFATTPNEFVADFLKKYNPEWVKISDPASSEKKSLPTEEKSSKIIFPEKDVLVHDEYPDSIVRPLCMHDYIPFAERCPNRWRTQYERFLINTMGLNLFLKEQENFAESALKKLSDNKSLSEDLITFLKQPQNFTAIWHNYFGNYYNSKNELKIADFICHVNTKSLDQLKETSRIYVDSQTLFNLIDHMPYELRKIVTAMISAQSIVGSGLLAPDDIQKLKWINTNCLNATKTSFNSAIEEALVRSKATDAESIMKTLEKFSSVSTAISSSAVGHFDKVSSSSSSSSSHDLKPDSKSFKAEK